MDASTTATLAMVLITIGGLIMAPAAEVYLDKHHGDSKRVLLGLIVGGILIIAIGSVLAIRGAPHGDVLRSTLRYWPYLVSGLVVGTSYWLLVRTLIGGERTARIKERESLGAEYAALKRLVASLQSTLKTTSDRLSALDVGQAGALRSEVSQLAARVREIESHGHGLSHICNIKDFDPKERQFITVGKWEGMEKRLPCQMIVYYEIPGGDGGTMHFTATAIRNSGDVSYVTVQEKISIAAGEKYLQMQSN